MIETRAVLKEKAENVSISLNRKYFEISARLGVNLRETVYSMVKEILKKKNFDPSINLKSKNDNKNNTSGGCCLGKKGNDNKKSINIKNKK